MLSPEEKFQRKQIRRAFFSSVLSITLVLFLLGIQGLLLIHANKLSSYVKENVCISANFKKNTPVDVAVAIQKQLDLQPAVKQTLYISADEAATNLQESLGKDFVNFLGYNPLSASLEIYLYADYANMDSLTNFKNMLLQNKEIQDIDIQENLVNLINDNVLKITYILLGISIVMLLIAIALIYNTIRLSIYAKRLTIRSMQLVGATRGFIRKPFIKQGLTQGVVAALIAIALNCVIIYYGIKYIPEIVSLSDIDFFLILFALLFLIAMLITIISSYFAVTKYLKMNKDTIHF
jgi:cell division transport system permease protein